MNLYEKIKNKEEKISLVGLGYVGMPIAVAFAKKAEVIGFDISTEKVELYKKGIDPTKEVGNDVIKGTTVEFTADENKLKEAIDQLTNRQRQVFMMRKKLGMNHADIAKQLNISVETAESTMKRALKSIRTYLMTHYPELMILVVAFILS